MNINKEKVSIDTRPIKCISEGNIVENKEFPAVVLVNEQQEVVSKEYYSIYELYDDHYIASAAVLTLDEESEKITAEIKAGIIRLTRDQNGKVIPFGEQTIVPFLYKDINGSNSNAVIASIEKIRVSGVYPRYTYIDLDIDSINYGKALVPATLSQAYGFDLDYEGFAKCVLLSKEGYLPRNCEPKEYIEPDDLLSKNELECLIYDTPRVKMKKLTGGYTMAKVQKNNK